MNMVFKVCIIIFFSCYLSAQDINIVKQLKMIEKGQINQAQVDLENLKSEFPDHPDIIFLDAVLTSDGKRAFKKYSRVYKLFPDSRFADAAVFRMFSYHFALGQYKSAENYKIILEDEYPRSPYIKIAHRNSKNVDLAKKSDFKSERPTSANLNSNQRFAKKRPANYNYTIQAGAFISKENAGKLSDRFTRRGFPVHILKKDVAGSILNIVTVGEFVSMEEARTALQSINREYDIKGRIIKPESYK